MALNKSLVGLTFKKNEVFIKFIDGDAPKFVAAAESLLELTRKFVHERRRLLELEKALRDKSATCNAPQFVLRGFCKLLIDRVEFAEAPPEAQRIRAELYEFGAAFFSCDEERLREITSKLKATGSIGESEVSDFLLDATRENSKISTSEIYRKYHSISRKLFEESLAKLDRGTESDDKKITAINMVDCLLVDLPDYTRAIAFRELTAQDLPHFYNLAQARWLLFFASELRIDLCGVNFGQARAFLRAARFHRLLIEIVDFERCDRIFDISAKLDGPISLPTASKIYGARLANFFPSLLQMPAWKLTAKIELPRKRAKTFSMDENCPLRGGNRRFSPRIPEEFGFFEREFTRLQNGEEIWSLAQPDNFLVFADKDANALCLPDYVVRRGHNTFFLEIFHAGHANILFKRLVQSEKILAAGKDCKLILLVDNRLARKRDVKKAMKKSPNSSEQVLVFRDFPTPLEVLKILRRLANKERSLF